MSKVDPAVLQKAVTALFDHDSKQKGSKSLLIDEYASPILVQLQLINEIKKPVVRPVRVKIPHTLFDTNQEDHKVCYFCKSEDKEAIVKYIETHKIEGLTIVLSINDVKKLYKEYKDRKELLKAHSHFICDANIMGQLYNLLGKVFSEKNNYPIPMNYGSPTSLADGIKKVVDSTYMHLKGKSITIRFGHTSMRSNDVVENIKVGLEFALQKIQNGWKDIQSIHVKTAYSSALPVYSKNKSESLEFIKSQVKGGESSAKAKGESAAKVKETAAKVKETAAKVKESAAAKVKEEGSVKTVASKKSDNKETVNEKEPAKKKGGKETRPVSAQSPVGAKIVDKKDKKSKK